MPKIFPFRATQYNPERISDLSKVTTQPYDKIDEALREEYAARHEHNAVRLIRPTGEDKYATAAQTLQEWIEAGVLVEDSEPAFFAYFQSYPTPQGNKTRKGVIALVRADPFGKGRVHPHEETHSGPKIDRFNLLSRTRTHFGQIFLLYSDPKRTVSEILDEASRRDPDLQSTDEAGIQHRVWRISDGGTIRRIQKDLDRRDAIIADGHHRYETSVRYHQEMKKKGARSGDAESFENVMATLVNMEDEGLTLYPTHRVVHQVAGFQAAALREGASKFFDVREYAFPTEEEEPAARREMLEDLRIEGFARPTIGVAVAGGSAYLLLGLRDQEAVAGRSREKRSREWRSLDVNVLHTLILDELLGVGKDQLDREQNVSFVRHADDAIGMLGEPGVQAAFLLNPVRVDQIRALVKNGERFPQKTTDFHPKLLTGLVFCRLRHEEK